MSDWTDYVAAARERGALACELFVVVSTPVAASEVVRRHLPDHLVYQANQEAAGALVFAGPMSDLTGETMEGLGMIVYRAASMEEARQIAEADPMHASGARSFTLRRWLLNEGSLRLEIGLSGGRLRLW